MMIPINSLVLNMKLKLMTELLGNSFQVNDQ